LGNSTIIVLSNAADSDCTLRHVLSTIEYWLVDYLHIFCFFCSR